ncbi:hypothetical protein SAMN03159341_10531 [Paenibacillus sp. 1_12]|uniref:hypothetical protein n=1 Tax=Paenibacillus sp. 1_12 TaxID=1566278 RepID=UPI0008DEBBA9|nr:hypothetical protein [Paenibacillus sp. 1_12]SFL31467.1 hypothetical protein SAMN03159341_10531 [Paenibacillus sp. 1_12]
MKTRYLILFSIMFIALVGCGNNSTSPINQTSTATNASAHEPHTAQPEKVAPASPIPNKETKYSLNASTYKENDNYYLKVNTNLKLSSEHYEGAPVDGEGHIHFFLNGKLVGPIKDTSPYPLQNLKEGTNTIKLVLAENNHSERFGVSKELSVEKAK